MIIKKFQGKNELEATELAKKELGNNIVIMNVKTMKKKGFLQFLKPAIVEITVALEEEKNSTSPIIPDSLWQEKAKNITEEFEDNVPQVIEKKIDSLQSFLEETLKANKEEQHLEEADEKEKTTEIMKFIRVLYNTMIDNEVKENYANQIVDEIEKNNKPNMPLDFALSTVYQKMILKFGQPELIKEAENKPKIIFFIGPTGVGKTTTIAKIASKSCVEEKKKIALLTTDTFRIAAAEQLRTYANILEIPFRIIYSPEEINQAASEFSEFDYIFVDTAGHSHQNIEQKDAIISILNSVKEETEKEVYLVLSATTKYRDLVSIAESYNGITNFKLIFTKLDETRAYGNLFNLRLHTMAPLSYITYGQNVPDDIEAFNPQTTVKKILSQNQ